MMTIKVVTIGVYGFTEESFFQALVEANVNVLCDIRQRRGVRGAKYAFANSRRLQRRLDELGIGYLHRRDLAPTPAVRQRQHEADRLNKTPKRQRTRLSEAFIAAYEEQILARFDPQSLLDELPADTACVALLCVEREPAACHRLLVSQKMDSILGVEVEHILP